MALASDPVLHPGTYAVVYIPASVTGFDPIWNLVVDVADRARLVERASHTEEWAPFVFKRRLYFRTFDNAIYRVYPHAIRAYLDLA